MIKTKAAVLYEIGLPKPYSSSKPLKIEEVIIDEPGENELIVQVKAAGLCHSDLSSINGNRPSCLLYTSPSPRDKRQSRMPSSA